MKRVCMAFIACCMMVMLGGIGIVSADPISREQAKEIAIEWMDRMGAADTFVSAEEILETEGVKAGYLIIFSPKGYVVVAGDDSLTPIKAWSGKGSFEGPMREMVLESLKNKIEEINQRIGQERYIDAGAYSTGAYSSLDADLDLSETGVKKIGPLLHTMWGQSFPYNNECPIDIDTGNESVTGCVATAAAQIMRWWKWPEDGIGNKCYINNDWDEICADFGHSYNWNAMPDKLCDNSSIIAMEEVSQLMYDVGVMADTEYSSFASWGYYRPLAEGLKKYMEYDCNSTHVNEAELFSTAKIDIDKGWPVFIGSKHAFVADGYLMSFGIKQLHFNFGWNGYSDGWYAPDGLEVFSFSDARKAYYVIKDLHPVCSANYPEFCANSDNCSHAGGIWRNNQCRVRCQPYRMTASSFPPKPEKSKIIIPARKILFQPELIIPRLDCGKQVQPVLYIYLRGHGTNKWFWGEDVTLQLCPNYRVRYTFFSEPIDFSGLSGVVADVYLGYFIGSDVLRYNCYQIEVK